MTPIQDIIRDPRYREFAAACCEHGRQVMPGSFPWKAMGMSTEAFLALPLQYEGGRPMEEAMKAKQLAIVRAQERLVEEWWDEWLDEQPPEPDSREAAVQELNPCRPGAQLTLF